MDHAVTRQPNQEKAPLVYVPIRADQFEDALKRYLDEAKPDRLAQRLIENLPIEWTTSSDESVTDDFVHNLQFGPTHGVRGCLCLVGRHVTVEVHANCYWLQLTKEDDDDATWLYFRLVVRGRPSDHRQTQSSSKEEMERLRSDHLVRKFLDDETPKLLCEASIHATKNELEERVDVSEEAAEGVRRTILSQLETSLDVVELLLSMPFLPTTAHNETMQSTCRLADRAKLRLLEDAMFDACEKEGEEEIIDDLRISHSDSEHPNPRETSEKERYDRPAKKNRSD